MTKKLSESSLLLTQEELQKHILGMTLFNDLLARAVLEDKEACEHILRILTGIKTLVIKKNKTQMLATTMPVFPLMAACTACWPKKPQYSLSLALAGTERIM